MAIEQGVHLTYEESLAKSRPTIYTEIIKHPSAKGILSFPVLAKQFPDVVFGSTFGRGNMSDGQVAKTEEAKMQALANTEAVFTDLHLANMENRVKILPVTGAARVAWVTQEQLQNNPNRGKKELVIHADAIFTEEEDVVVMVKPGDCPVAIVVATRMDDEGNEKKAVGLIHIGAKQADANLPLIAIWALKLEGYDPKNIHIGLTPGIEMDSFPIRETGLLVDAPNFDKWRSSRRKIVEQSDKERLYYVDIAGHTVDQFIIEGGIPDTNIEMYRRDTFTNKELFSSRRAEAGKGEDGRDLVVVQVKGKNPKSMSL